MIKSVEGFDKYIAIAGFKEVHIDDVDSFLNMVRGALESGEVAVQFFDAKLIAGWQHLYFAVLNALNAFKNGDNISKNLAVECLLYASAQRQIKMALKLIGLKEDSTQIAVLIVAENEDSLRKSLSKASKLVRGKRDDSVVELSREKMSAVKRLFGISDLELATELDEKDGEVKALTDLVIEHIALLVTLR